MTAATKPRAQGRETAPRHAPAARPPLRTVDWATVPLDPDAMSERAREGFWFLADLMAEKMIRMEREAQAR